MSDQGKSDPPAGSGDEPRADEEPKRARSGRKASKAEAPKSPPRDRTSSLDPWKKARERVLEKTKAENTQADKSRVEKSRVEKSQVPKGRTGAGDKPTGRTDDRPVRPPADRRPRTPPRPREFDRGSDRDKPAFDRRKTDSQSRGPARDRAAGDPAAGDRPRGPRKYEDRGRGDRKYENRGRGASDGRRPESRPPSPQGRRDDRRADSGPPRRRDDRPQGPPDRRGGDSGRNYGDRRPGDRRPSDRRPSDRRPSDRRPMDPQRRDPEDRRRPHDPNRSFDRPTFVRRDRDDIPRDQAQVRAGARLAEVEELELKVEKLVYGGDGLARFEGIPIFVPRSAPGDRIRARLTERKMGYGRAEIVEILEPGPDRRKPPCAHFERCGGCDLQHLEDSAQLRLKAESVVETLRRIGAVKPPAKFEIIAGAPFGYRLRTQLHLGTTERGLEVGYFARGSHDLVPVTECPVLVPQLEEQLPSLPERLQDAPHARVDFAAGDGDQWAVAPPHGDLPKGEITITAGGFAYSYDARCFFQGHQGLVDDLVAQAIGDFGDEEGNAYDLFSGVGLFSLPLSRKYKRIVSVEGDRVAARFARRNAKANRTDNVEVVAQSVESWIDHLPKDAARVVVDPPRVGLSDKVRRALMARRPRQLTYVSCEPPTLARDLKELGRIFRIDSLVLIDMFPQTGHMESVVQMSLPK